jgi:hypothetical protein
MLDATVDPDGLTGDNEELVVSIGTFLAGSWERKFNRGLFLFVQYCIDLYFQVWKVVIDH